jgi:hypothetical protein
MDLSFLDIGTGWRRVASVTPRPLYHRGKSPRYPLDRKLIGPQSRPRRPTDQLGENRLESQQHSIILILDNSHCFTLCVHVIDAVYPNIFMSLSTKSQKLSQKRQKYLRKDKF